MSVFLDERHLELRRRAQAWADGAASYPKAEQWAQRAAPFLLALGSKDNGRSLTVS